MIYSEALEHLKKGTGGVEVHQKCIEATEKLQKIEETLKEYQDGKDVFSGMDESYVVGKIEQILKGVES